MPKRNWITLIVRWDVMDADGFIAMTEEMAQASRREPGTHLYDWYLDRATGQSVLLESYPLHEALMTHVEVPCSPTSRPDIAAWPAQLRSMCSAVREWSVGIC